MPRKIEQTNIPSDTESIDGLCEESDDENYAETPTDEILNCSDDDSSDDENVTEDSGDEVWKSCGKKRNDLPFTNDFGPNILENATSPREIFICLFPDDLVDLIVYQTNLYIDQKKKKDFITKDELITFLGINILMGVKKLPAYRDYWSTDPKLNDPYISSLMTGNRFGFILNNLHLSDNTKEAKKGTPNYDKLYKLRPLLTRLGETFKNCWKPSKYQSVDESMIKFKGRTSLKQYMPAKPIKRGYKVWVRADESSYVCEFQIYTGKTESIEKQLGARVVKDLTRALVGGNHHVYFDNFFTGVELMISLKQDNIFACGTVRSNRTRLPKAKISDKQMNHGQFECQTSNTGIRWVKWMDKKAVFFLSNYHDPRDITTVNRRQKDGTLKQVDCPVMCSDYNKYMGFVDSADRLLSTYKIDRKSKRWWLRIFWHFVDLSVTNAFIIHSRKDEKNSLTLKKFRLRLVDELVGHQNAKLKGRKRQSTVIGYHKPQVPVEKRRSESSHMPVHTGKPRRCACCSTKDDQKRSTWMCNMCNVPLCISATKNCFFTYHN